MPLTITHNTDTSTIDVEYYHYIFTSIDMNAAILSDQTKEVIANTLNVNVDNININGVRLSDNSVIDLSFPLNVTAIEFVKINPINGIGYGTAGYYGPVLVLIDENDNHINPGGTYQKLILMDGVWEASSNPPNSMTNNDWWGIGAGYTMLMNPIFRNYRYRYQLSGGQLYMSTRSARYHTYLGGEGLNVKINLPNPTKLKHISIFGGHNSNIYFKYHWHAGATIKITYEDGSIESFDNPNKSTNHSVHIMHPNNAASTNNYTIMRQKANFIPYGSYTPWYVVYSYLNHYDVDGVNSAAIKYTSKNLVE